MNPSFYSVKCSIKNFITINKRTVKLVFMNIVELEIH